MPEPHKEPELALHNENAYGDKIAPHRQPRILGGRRDPTKENPVKKIEIIPRSHKLEDVKEKLTAIGVKGMTVTECKGFGHQRGHKEVYRGAEYQVDFLPKIKIEVVIPDEMLHDTMDAISEAARTGQIGDAKIFISPAEEVVRIRTGGHGEEAI